MEYIEIHCQVHPLEPWSGILIAELADIGFESFSEEPEGFKAYISACSYRAKAVTAVYDKYKPAGPQKLSFEMQRIGGKNWNAVWESNFDPVLIGSACHVRAPFHAARKDVPYDIVIEPKMSFGTGHHETTALVIEWLLEIETVDKSVLDMGCGTGVLAILSALRGATRVTAIDNYLFAYENTLENAHRNGIEKMEVLHGDASLLGNAVYDIVIANITRNVLLEDMGAYARVLRNGGVMLLSGFLILDKDVIFAEADRQGLRIAGEKSSGDWLSVKLIK